MRFPILSLFALLTATGARAPAQPAPAWNTDLAAALAQAKASQRPVLAVFSGSDWCKPCIMLKQDVFDQPEFAQYAQDKFVLARFDFPRNRTLARAGGPAVAGLPRKNALNLRLFPNHWGPNRVLPLMKRLAAFCLSLLMLLGSCVPENDLGELAKLPELARHYRFHHSAAGGGLTLGQFLAEHYGAGSAHYTGCTLSARHQQDHHNLPLRCHHDCGAVAFLVAPAPQLGWAARVPRAVPGPHSTWAGLYRFQPSGSLLQPPRA